MTQQSPKTSEELAQETLNNINSLHTTKAARVFSTMPSMDDKILMAQVFISQLALGSTFVFNYLQPQLTDITNQIRSSQSQYASAAAKYDKTKPSLPSKLTVDKVNLQFSKLEAAFKGFSIDPAKFELTQDEQEALRLAVDEAVVSVGKDRETIANDEYADKIISRATIIINNNKNEQLNTEDILSALGKGKTKTDLEDKPNEPSTQAVEKNKDKVIAATVNMCNSLVTALKQPKDNKYVIGSSILNKAIRQAVGKKQFKEKQQLFETLLPFLLVISPKDLKAKRNKILDLCSKIIKTNLIEGIGSPESNKAVIIRQGVNGNTDGLNAIATQLEESLSKAAFVAQKPFSAPIKQVAIAAPPSIPNPPMAVPKKLPVPLEAQQITVAPPPLPLKRPMAAPTPSSTLGIKQVAAAAPPPFKPFPPTPKDLLEPKTVPQAVPLASKPETITPQDVKKKLESELLQWQDGYREAFPIRSMFKKFIKKDSKDLQELGQAVKEWRQWHEDNKESLSESKFNLPKAYNDSLDTIELGERISKTMTQGADINKEFLSSMKNKNNNEARLTVEAQIVINNRKSTSQLEGSKDDGATRASGRAEKDIVSKDLIPPPRLVTPKLEPEVTKQSNIRAQNLQEKLKNQGAVENAGEGRKSVVTEHVGARKKPIFSR